MDLHEGELVAEKQLASERAVDGRLRLVWRRRALGAV